MLKSAVGTGFRLARRAVYLAAMWVAAMSGDPSATETPSVEEQPLPPFSYGDSNDFFRKTFIDHHLRRPHLAWGALQGVNLAKALGLSRVSFIEFGVAGGNGLTALEDIAQKLQATFGIEIEIHGFDAIIGMPKARDYRDTPNLWHEGSYSMNTEKLEHRLKKAQLHLGMIGETLTSFVASRPAPVAFIEFDFCYYSSTKEAFQLLDADPGLLLPRIHCFFRNILGNTYGDFNGERLAISEYDESHEMRKISKIYGLQYFLRPNVGRWADQYYMAHIFDHPLYGSYDGLIREATLDLREEKS